MNTPAALLSALLRDDDPDRALLGSSAFDLAGTLEGLGGYQRKDHGDGNSVLTHPDAKTGAITFEPGSRNNTVVSGTRLASRQPVVIAGTGNHVIIGPTKKFTARIAVTGDENLFFSGFGSTCNQANIVLQGHGRSIIRGKDCMLSFDVTIRAADSHAIVDLTTDAVVNAPESIVIGTHVWLGEGMSVRKATLISNVAIIAMRATIKRHHPTGDCAWRFAPSYARKRIDADTRPPARGVVASGRAAPRRQVLQLGRHNACKKLASMI